jgi:hypothetical protein
VQSSLYHDGTPPKTSNSYHNGLGTRNCAAKYL